MSDEIVINRACPPECTAELAALQARVAALEAYRELSWPWLPFDVVAQARALLATKGGDATSVRRSATTPE